MIRPATLVIALVLAAPALWQAFFAEDFDINRVLTRYLIAVPVAALMIFCLSVLTDAYRRAVAAREEAELEEQMRKETEALKAAEAAALKAAAPSPRAPEPAPEVADADEAVSAA
ncbi:hypothetical protein GCM10009682_23220 [Luedemannella flava]|uniref:Uncharacterized protein n=1 Tax=Luedemannella flava TaxID=349316 RepID=A0ABP4Y990_9ACTN